MSDLLKALDMARELGHADPDDLAEALRIIDDLKAQLDDLLDTLQGVIRQACEDDTGVLDSMALSAYAYGLNDLATHGRVVIDRQAGRRIIARVIEQPATSTSS